MTKTLIVANWKMNPPSLTEAKWLFDSITKGIKDIKNVEMVICPPFIYLSKLKTQNSKVKMGAQDLFYEKRGAFTGEISPLMLKDIGCQYVIVGHSERRRYFNETDEMINKKIKAAIKTKLKPIFCIGETQEERDRDETSNILKFQIEKGLNKIEKKELKNVILAYEPVWAIGTGNPCDPEEAQKMGLLIRKIISKLYNLPVKKSGRWVGSVQILYGGSVNSKNATDYVKEASFQGLLVGGASLKPKEFVEIIKVIAKAVKPI